MTNLLTITREQLYEAICSKPLAAIAKDYGISDVAVAKSCKKLEVPKPKLGYWAKKQYGKRVRQIPLPPIRVVSPRHTPSILPQTTFLKTEVALV